MRVMPKRYVAGSSSSVYGPQLAASLLIVVGGTCKIAQTEASTPPVTWFTPRRISRVNPYHLAYGVAGRVPKVRRDGAAAAVERAELESGPESAIDSCSGTASRKASAPSSFLSSMQPDKLPRTRVQPASQRRVFAYIVGDLLWSE